MPILIQNKGLSGRFKISGNTTGGFKARYVGVDTDAQAFFSRVTAAGGTLSATEQSAIIQLVSDLKSAGIWTLMKTMYPMVGASAAACAQNLKSSSFTGTFNGTWTFASTGITGNGTNAYMETNFNQQGSWTSTSNGSMGFVSATNNTTNVIDMGSVVLNDFLSGGSVLWVGTTYYSSLNGDVATPGDANASTIGFFVATRTISTEHRRYKRGSSVINRTIVDGIPANINRSITLGAGRDQSGIGYFSAKRYNFCFIGDGLTEAQVDSYWTILQTFNTSLSR